MSYAVYVVIVEDTEEADTALLTSVVAGERYAGGRSYDDCDNLLVALLSTTWSEPIDDDDQP